jgi:hypothetical protein
LEAGENTELVITYNTFKYDGKFDKTVNIFTGADGKEETVIRLIGTVDPIPMGVIEMVPRKTEIGTLALNKENSVSVVLKNTGDAPLTVTKISSQKFNTVYFDGEKKGPMTIPAGQTQTVKVTIVPAKAGRFLDSILIFSDARNDIGNGYKGILAGEVK